MITPAESTARDRLEPGTPKSETGLTADAAELDGADIEPLLDGEVAALVKGHICEVDVLEAYTDVCRYSRKDDLGRTSKASTGGAKTRNTGGKGGVKGRTGRPHTHRQ